MKKYALRKIGNAKTVDEYNDMFENAEILYFNSLKEVWDYCGGKLHRERCGYGGYIGGYEYILLRVA